MPTANVGGKTKHFPYTPAGRKAAAKAQGAAKPRPGTKRPMMPPKGLKR